MSSTPTPAASRLRLHARALALALLAGLSALPACDSGDKGPVAFGGGLQTLKELEADPFYRAGFRREWSTFVPVAEAGRLQRLEHVGDFIVARDSSNLVSLILPEGGEVRWSAPIGSSLQRYVGSVRQGALLLVCSETELFAMDTVTGNLIDRQTFERVVNTRPAQFGPLLVFGTASDLVIAHLTDRRIRAWAYGVNAPIVADPVQMNGGLVAFISQIGEVIILDGISGSAAARFRLLGGVTGRPTTDGNRLFVASLDQSLYAFAPGTPRPLWRVRTDRPLTDAPVYHDGRVYLNVPGQGLTAFDANTGAQRWNEPKINGTVISVQGRDLIVWNGKTLARVATRDGAILEQGDIPGVADLITDRFVDGNLYAAHPSGGVTRFQPR